MADYASLKVPDLKKLLSERSLPQSGNKADLIARLQENDKSTSFIPVAVAVVVRRRRRSPFAGPSILTRASPIQVTMR